MTTLFTNTKKHKVCKPNIRKICTLSYILLFIFKISDYIILNIRLEQKIQNDEILTRIDITRDIMYFENYLEEADFTLGLHIKY